MSAPGRADLEATLIGQPLTTQSRHGYKGTSHDPVSLGNATYAMLHYQSRLNMLFSMR